MLGPVGRRCSATSDFLIASAARFTAAAGTAASPFRSREHLRLRVRLASATATSELLILRGWHQDWP
ncbi:MAG: hypothetical protein M3017_06140 [Actinomycetota bacterium]|nr:hypothetical protein [Actinomycetota bacterium]